MPAGQPERASRSGPVVSFLTDDSIDSFDRVARWLGRGFAELGVSYEAVSIQGPPGVRTDGSVRLVRLGVPRAYRWPSAFTRYLRRARPDLCLVAPAYMVPFAAAAGRLAGVPVVPWEASFLALELRIEDVNPRLRLVPALERITQRWVPITAVVSQDVGDHFVREVLRRPRGSDGLFVLPNPIDAEEVGRLARPVQARRSSLRLCAAGRLVRQKGFDILIEALALAGPLLGDWELVLLGDGAQRAELEGLVRARHLTDRVRLLGAVDNPYPVIAGADLLVHPARWEPFGVVLLEALALGVPVVATDCPGGTREILLDGECGVLVPPEDPASLSSAIAGLAGDAGRRQRLADRGVRRIRDFGPPVIARRALELVELVGTDRGGRSSVGARRVG
jgi:glycosyltransferase involved in cell wall biosynthesis